MLIKPLWYNRPSNQDFKYIISCNTYDDIVSDNNLWLLLLVIMK